MQDKALELMPQSAPAEESAEEQISQEGSKQSHPQKRRRLSNIMRIVSSGVLGALIARGGISVANDVIKPNLYTNLAIPVTENFSPTDTKDSIENKYNINLITMKQALEIYKLNYDENDIESIGPRPPVRWEKDQVVLLDRFLSNLPQNLHEPRNGKKLEIFLGDFGTGCACGGISLSNSGIIGIDVDGFTQNPEWSFSTLTHELTHRLDAQTGQSLWPKINAIIGNKEYMQLDEFKVEDESLNPDQGLAVVVLKSLASNNLSINFGPLSFGRSGGLDDKHINFHEGVAEISELYVRGHNRFVEAIGPLLDGKGYSDSGEDNIQVPTEDLSTAFPKTQALYDLYKNEVFAEKEYDLALLEQIKYSPADLRNKEQKEEAEYLRNRWLSSTSSVTSQESDSQEQAQEALKSFEGKYNIQITNKSGRDLTTYEISRIAQGLDILPKDFLSLSDANKFKLVFVSGQEDQERFDKERSAIIINVDYMRGSFGSVSNFIRDVARGIIIEKYDDVAGVAEAKITDIIGKDKFPAISKSSGGDIAEIFYKGNKDKLSIKEVMINLLESYLGGWRDFSLFVGMVTDPEIDWVNIKYNSPDKFPDTRVSKLYQILKQDVFKGTEYFSTVGNQSFVPDADFSEAEKNTRIGEEYNIQMINTTGKSFSAEELNLLKQIFQVFPKDFYDSFKAKKLQIEIVDGDYDGFQETGRKISIPRANLKKRALLPGSAGVLNGVVDLAHYLVSAKDEASGNKYSNQLIQILGGENFLESPESIFPKLKELRDYKNDALLRRNYLIFYSNNGNLNTSLEITAQLGALYTGGWETFGRTMGRYLDPGIDMLNSSMDHSGTETAKLYEYVKNQIFEGEEFDSTTDGQGIPGKFQN